MKQERPSIVLFDMDGTTVRHINPRILGTLEKIDDAMFKVSRWFHRNKPQPDFTPDMEKKPRLLVHRALHKFRRRPIDQIVQPCPGIYTILNLFKDAGIPMGIVSNGLGKGYGHDILEKFALAEFFQSQVFREDIQRSKPDPDPLLRALKKLNRVIGENDVIWYIGDRHKDVAAALAADEKLPAKVIPFAYGLHASMAILEKGQSPDQIIMNYTDFAAKIFPLMTNNEAA
jgi:phosphoglycolate phosphatase